jgi:predicted nucleic acid-binding protein
VDNVPEATPELTALVQEFALHAGETEALRLMLEAPAAILLSDDGAARSVATRMGYLVQGTLGILLRSWRLGRLSKRKLIYRLRAIPRRTSLHVSTDLLNAVIAEASETNP